MLHSSVRMSGKMDYDIRCQFCGKDIPSFGVSSRLPCVDCGATHCRSLAYMEEAGVLAGLQRAVNGGTEA